MVILLCFHLFLWAVRKLVGQMSHSKQEVTPVHASKSVVLDLENLLSALRTGLLFLLRVLKDLQGYQGSQERGARE